MFAWFLRRGIYRAIEAIEDLPIHLRDKARSSAWPYYTVIDIHRDGKWRESTPRYRYSQNIPLPGKDQGRQRYRTMKRHLGFWVVDMTLPVRYPEDRETGAQSGAREQQGSQFSGDGQRRTTGRSSNGNTRGL